MNEAALSVAQRRGPSQLQAAQLTTASPVSEPQTVPGAVRSPAQRLLDLYIEQSQYPPTSRPLHEQQTDLIFPNRRYEQPRPIGEGERTLFLFTADRYFVHAEQTLTLLLQVTRDLAPHPIAIVEATLSVPDANQITAVKYAYEGGIYLSQVVPAQLFSLERATMLLATVTFEPRGANTTSATLRIHYTPTRGIPAQFSGRFRHSIEGGSLLVNAELLVSKRGYFVIDCNLWRLDNQPVAWTRFKGELETGRRHVPLLFFGKVLRDSGQMPPYRLGELRGFRFVEGATPDTETIPPYEGQVIIDGFSLADLSDQPWNDAHKRATIRALKRGIDRGSLIAPPLAP